MRPPSKSLLMSFFFLIALIGAMPARAESEPDDAREKQYAFSVTFENDTFFNTDHYYTDGFQIDWKSWGIGSSGESKVLDSLCFYIGCAVSEPKLTRSKVGQLMYTPSNIGLAGPQPLDHPWGGYLYFQRNYDFLQENGLKMTTITGQLGVIGPHSYAEQTQKWIHERVHATYPQGWNNQIGGAVGLLFSVEKRYAFGDVSTDPINNTRLRTSSYWNLTVGNVMTYTAAGLTFTLGKNLPALAAKEPGIITNKAISPNSLQLNAPSDTSCLFHWLQCTFFANAEVRLVAFNVFLDGNLGRNDPHVDRRPLVADISLGARLQFPHSRNACTGPIFVQFKATHRTPEFRSAGPVSSQSWGALTAGVDF